MRFRLVGSLAVLGLLTLSGCGYTLATSKNELLQAKGVRTIYVAPVRNDSFKSGAENLMYNEVVRMLATTQTLRVVRKAEEADAVLFGSIQRAVYVPAGTTTGELLGAPSESDRNVFRGVPVASEYALMLDVSFRLERRVLEKPTDKKVLWSGAFSRSRRFPANNNLGVYGTTSGLINDSEFDRALRESAASMAVDIYESMIALF